jgi:hypothetical protein
MRSASASISMAKDGAAESRSLFKERQEILDHEVAGQVQDGSDNHERECEPHP